MKIRTFTQDEAVEFLKKKKGKLSDSEFAKSIGVALPTVVKTFRRERVPGRAVGFEQIRDNPRFRWIGTRKERLIRELREQAEA